MMFDLSLMACYCITMKIINLYILSHEFMQFDLENNMRCAGTTTYSKSFLALVDFNVICYYDRLTMHQFDLN